jgi:hypothetical protein
VMPYDDIVEYCWHMRSIVTGVMLNRAASWSEILRLPKLFVFGSQI